ncbi:MAG: DEAD/DEAH box helicase family protein, partial [bacterium]|nr:DEAD/DEAH box helicase family protein [bacterium]
MFEFKTTPYPHQMDAFNRFKDSRILALLCDMGTGKTKIAIDISAHKYLKGEHDRILVIGPNIVHQQWINEQFPIHCPVPWRGISYKSKKTMKNLRAMDSFLIRSIQWDELLVLTINYESFVRPIGTEIATRFFETSSMAPIIILDEASRIKNPSTKTAKNIKKMTRSFEGSYKMILTGTPAAKSPTNMWSLYDFLRKNYMRCSYTAFESTYSIRIVKKFEVKDKLVSVDSTLD